MIVVEHRPPLRRIEIGAAVKPPSAPDPYVDVYADARVVENERIWRTIRQAAQGHGAAGDEH
jgi:hypothetical protein